MQESKRAIRAAVIDDGIQESMDSVFTKINRFYVEKERVCQGTAVPIPPLSHGTIWSQHWNIAYRAVYR